MGAYFLAMLVSAAIDPYRKSYGNARNNSATATGSALADCMTASPRNTCVPGVHAKAADGVRAIAITATTMTRIVAAALGPSRADSGLALAIGGGAAADGGAAFGGRGARSRRRGRSLRGRTRCSS